MFDQIIREIQSKSEFSKQDIENICDRILRESSYPKDEPIPIIQIAKKMGFSVYQHSLQKELSGFIAVDENLKGNSFPAKFICINKDDEIGHQRFVIAHELAHFLFDYNPSESAFYDTYFKDSHNEDKEQRANYFAANLLMPRERIVKEIVELPENFNMNEVIERMADKFLVQKKAIEKRIHEI